MYFGSGGYSWATGDYIRQTSQGRIQIFAGGTNHGHQFVVNQGNVGIGALNPDKQLEISNNGDAWLRIGADADNVGGDNGTQNAYLQLITDANNEGYDGLIWLENLSGDTKLHFDVENQDAMVIHNGNIGIGTNAPNQRLTVYNGSTTGTYTTSGWMHTSDKSLKTNITEIDDALGIVSQLNGVRFNWKGDNSNKQIGFIAQDVEKIIPEVVEIDNEGNYCMSYDGVIPVLVEALKTLQSQNEELTEKLQYLETQIDKLNVE